MKPFLRALLALVCFLPFCATLHAQDTPDKIDVRPFAPHDGSSLESVSLTNGSLVMNIPLWSFHQRGKLKLDFSITYDSPNYDFVYQCNALGQTGPNGTSNQTTSSGGYVPASGTNVGYDTAKYVVPGDNGVDLATAQPDAQAPASPCVFPYCRIEAYALCISYWEISQVWANDWGTWPNAGVIGVRITSSTDYAVYPVISVTTSPNAYNTFWGYFFSLHTPDGGTHNLAKTAAGDFRVTDGTGFSYSEVTCQLTDGDGTVYQFGCVKDPNATANIQVSYYPHELQAITDVNGNRITLDTTGWTDTEGRLIPPLPTRTASGMPSGSLPGCPSGTTTSANWQLPGVPHPITICSTGVDINTDIQWPHTPDNSTYQQATEVTGTYPMLSGFVLPSEETWQFSYTPDVNDSLYGTAYNYGNLSKVKLPTGGTITYDWAINHATCGNNSRSVRSSVVSRTLRSDLGAAPATWTYGFGEQLFQSGNTSPVVTTVTDPVGNVDRHTLGYLDYCTYFETGVDHYDDTNQLLRSEFTEFQVLPVLPSLVNVPLGTNPVLPIAKHTLWPDGKSQTTKYVYDTGYSIHDTDGVSYINVPYGNKIKEVDYDFATGSASGQINLGAELRETGTGYWIDGQTQGPLTSPLTWNLLRLPSQVATLDVSNQKLQITQYGYDETTPAASGLTPSASWTNAPGNGGVRGNQTSVSRYLDTTGGSLTTTVTYTDTGMVSSITLPHDAATPDTTTTYTYDPAYQGALLTGITDALGHTTTYTYNALTDQPLTATDPNNATTTYTYYDDTRLHTVTLPADAQGQQGVTEYRYPSPTEVDSRTKQTASTWITHHDLYDGLGRKTQSVLVGGCSSGLGSGGDILTDTTYDLLDRVATESNPYCSGFSSSTDGTTTHTYDALNRPVLLTHPDGNMQQWSYSDDTTLFTDENGSQWSRTNDALGRLVNVLEPDPVTGTPTLSTAYAYDAFNNLLGVNQQGSSAAGEIPRTRSFTYDSLNRLLTSQNPETGTICYGMWVSGANPNLEPIHQPGNPPGGGGGGGGGGSTNNSPCQGGYDAHGNLVAKTDANGTLLQYGYDALNRLTSKYAPDGGNTDFGFVYDQGVNGIGRLTTEYNPNGTAGTAFDYDALGHTIRTQWYNLNAFAWQDAMTGLQYDFAGNLTQLVYPDGRTVQQIYDAANRLAEVDDITDSSNPVAYFSGAQYFPSGALQSNTYGNGVTSTLGVNNRLQPCSEFAGASAPGPHHGTLVRTIFNRQLYYAATPETNCGAATSNNGNIAHVIEGVALDTTQDFSYDKLNRLLSASSTNRPADTSYNQSYGYDSFGNMLPTDHINTSPNYSRDAATNHLLLNGTDYTYDAAGQLVGAPAITGYHSLWYTAEGYLRSIDNYNTGSYLYNALGERTLSNHGSSGGWDLYVYLNSQPMADYDNTGTWTDNIYANGQKIARVANDPVNGVSTKYYLADQLGTTQMELDATGNVLWQGAFTPFGQEIVNGVAPTYLGTQPADGTSNRYKFTGKERDNESGFDYFGARYYASGMGRWTTPDWSAKEEPVPYATLDNPQSLNLYGYVLNNPLSHADTDGHCCDWLPNVVDYGVGVARGVASSVSFGLVGAPKSSDSMASLAGQLAGTGFAGTQGAQLAGEGAFEGGAALALAPETGGVSLGALADAGAKVAVGSFVATGAATNAGAVVNAMAMKPGSSGGPGSGKKTTPAQREQTLKENGGKCVVSGCNEPATHVDHANPRSRGGDTTPENLQGMCAHHNCQKGAKTSQEYQQWLKDQKK